MGVWAGQGDVMGLCEFWGCGSHGSHLCTAGISVSFQARMGCPGNQLGIFSEKQDFQPGE